MEVYKRLTLLTICNAVDSYLASYVLCFIRKDRLAVLLYPVTDFHQSWYGQCH